VIDDIRDRYSPELLKSYKDSGLAQIAFNSNGQDFYPETAEELLAWRDDAVRNILSRFKAELEAERPYMSPGEFNHAMKAAERAARLK
jgi:hypothetical protein